LSSRHLQPYEIYLCNLINEKITPFGLSNQVCQRFNAHQLKPLKDGTLNDGLCFHHSPWPVIRPVS